MYTNPEGWRLPTFFQMQDYFNAVEMAEGLPVMACMSFGLAGEYAAFCDCLLLGGGEDVSPIVYAEQDRGSLGCDLRRDEFELELFHAFRKLGKPILGICRGHQLVNTALGGALLQDIKNELGMEHPCSVDHTVQITGGRLFDLFGQKALVNSTHHQAVTPDKLAPGLAVTATSEDGAIIEGCELGNIMTVQFHPEMYLQQDARMLEIFKWLIHSALISD